MCRIAGYFKHETSEIDFDVVGNMIQLMKHGGPDNQHVDFFPQGVLGHARLSILDLSDAANQPFKWSDYVICYNGEIYNYREIRNDLIKDGYSFETSSDTEVILKSYDAWGLSCLNKFIGMFAFALWDDKNARFILTRDRVGVKPLHYAKHKGGIYFFSELKAVHAIPDFKLEIDHSVIPDYLRKGYVSGNQCIFKGVKKVKPGSAIIFDKSMNCSSEVYWNTSTETFGTYEGNYEQAKEEVKNALIKSVDYRLVSDVPVGVFLSGGIDSSLVTAIAASELNINLKTFTIAFDNPKYNEALLARKIALTFKTEHYEFKCNESTLLDLFDELAFVYDEPFGDASALPTLFLSSKTREHVKVSLGGDGGDEVFGGYVKYKFAKAFNTNPLFYKTFGRMMRNLGVENSSKISEILLSGRYKNIGTKVRKFINASSSNDVFNFFDSGSDFIDDNQLSQCFLNPSSLSHPSLDNKEFSNDYLLNELGVLDVNYYLTDDLLVKVDRASMRYGLEAREPLLDHNLISLGLSLPDKWKLAQGETKSILRDILGNYLPKSITQAPKAGFSVPVAAWLLNDLAHEIDKLKSDSHFFQIFSFNQSYLVSLINSFYEGKNTIDPQFIWNLLMLYKWSKKWLT